MLLGNQGLVTQVNIESSGNVVISPLSTSVGWASTGGLKITSTGFPTSTSIDIASGNIVISTGNLGTITSLTSGTVTATQSGTWNVAISTSFATTPTIYAVTLSLTDTEYSQAFLANTRAFEFKCRTDTDIRYAFTSGIIATPSSSYMTLKAGTEYYKEDLNLATSQYIYIATDSTAAPVTEITMWT